MNWRSWGPLCWVLAFFTASYQHLLWTPTHQGPKPLRPGVAFPTTTCLPPSPTVCNSTGTWLPSWLRYIIIQRPHDRPLDLWNRMFNRHQAEITVMQFTGHSLPVHQSMSVPWEFFSSSHFISQFPPTRFPLITAIRMYHLLPVHHLGMAFWPGQKSKYNIMFLSFSLLFEIGLCISNRNTWNHLTVCNQMNSGSFKNCYMQTISLKITLYMHEQDLALNNL